MKRPLVLGHRGASAEAPENTLASFHLARQQGADGIELDVTVCRDKVPVVIHDDTVDRTTNGHGRVAEMTVLELKQLNAGSWKGNEFDGQSIPLLADVLDDLSGWLHPLVPAHNPPAVINIEIKGMGLHSVGVEREVVNLLSQKNAEDAVIISSFNPLALIRIKALNPNLARGLIYSPDLPTYLRKAWLRLLAAPHALHPAHNLVDQAYMGWAKRIKKPVNTWTVDEPDEAKRLSAMEVNSITTDCPDLILKALKA